MLETINLLNTIKTLGLEKEVFEGNFGLEKENVRVDRTGKLALSPHPVGFGNKLQNPFITTDFSESQIEMITPTCNTLQESYNFLENINHIVSLELEDEYLWPQSAPPLLPNEESIPIARYDSSAKGHRAEEYRMKLAEKYGKKKQLISGIHFNFSFTDHFLQMIHQQLSNGPSFKEFKNEVYLKVSRNFLKYRWLLIYLFGASVSEKCFDSTCNDRSHNNLEYGSSFRNGLCGYRNKTNFHISHRNVEEYLRDLNTLIKTGEISGVEEYYSPVKLKPHDKKNYLSSLSKDGIAYVEFRILDLNPLQKVGIDLNTLEFFHLFILYTFFINEKETKSIDQNIALKNHNLVASLGRKPQLMLLKNEHEKISMHDWGHNILDKMLDLARQLGIKENMYKEIIRSAKEKIDNPEITISSVISKGVKEDSYIDYHLNLAELHLKESKKKKFNLLHHEDLELSTQILLMNAIKSGVKFEILDRQENFVLLDNGIQQEYVKQATKTSLDSYSTVLIMENKLVTKKVLNHAGIKVPNGEYYNNINEAKNAYHLFCNQDIVIKPKSTNFGIGITILKNGFSQHLFEKAVEIAFTHDASILIEEFVDGKEYRFLVIGDDVVGILNRVPANVIGDGYSNITKLVVEKNKDPLRGKGYKTPLERIDLGEPEKLFLREQGKDFMYIPKHGERIFLRENSNISTGGDSIDYTDEIPVEYKMVAIKAAKAAGATICGVDMVIPDITKKNIEENYAIIELNFNPAIHIHSFPYKGRNRMPGQKIIKALGF
ncbi:bifunctional glutamate--cysteine ligase GshA/glutathione synthetase GshB [Cytobacillus sp. IB215665]|uniref:bifunctional glutamate--cysteine ligase GshA/glutathione synthetase GshB n=1 Tax=Cytobacillus sp. IB215665 TaxID=3097357 RepID=UPI002A160635|nr:bifunctional glutamate--cysteine ligase GshA/glutathione synthetase GshB [Cytobacillus sp. IB215665]MDX8366139.1 bifunctional glutamate--cysteine ligase GshA/glutathione synthetase GshB [Cytobacillus sp. IB215665]